MADPRPLTRKELAEFLPNQRAIRAFEKIFDLLPADFVDQQIQIDALELLTSLTDARANEALDALTQLAEDVSTLVRQSKEEAEDLDDDQAPRGEFGTLSAQNEDEVDITGGRVAAQITDSSSDLIKSSTTCSDGAAAATGTLTNAPTAGDPTKWVAIDDNGTTRYIPAW